MLFFMVLLILNTSTYAVNKNVGSVLFNAAHIHSSYWTTDEIAKLQARKLFECLIPPSYNPEKVNNKYIEDSLSYFRSALISVQKGVDENTAEILKEALADTLGAHLKYEILPPIRFAYYAGYIPFRTARKLHDFYDQIKLMLNTQGVGWKQPERIPKWTNITVAKIFIGSGKLLDPCASLVIKRDMDSCIHLPSPRLDNSINPLAISLPFRSEPLVNLKSSNAENIILKYYTTALRCLLHSSPANCRHEDVVNFNNEIWNWMKHNVAPHLADENLYAAYGGILRIAAAVQNYGKGLSRRNIFDDQELSLAKKNPWKAIIESYKNVNTNWTPIMYIAVVFMIALAMYLLHICYYCMYRERNPCTRNKKSRASATTALSAKIERGDISPTTVQLDQSEMFSNHQKSSRHLDISKSSSMKNQKVYDLNENIERVMPVLFSDNENSPEHFTSSHSDGEDNRTRKICNTIDGAPKSPPKLETPIAQLTIEKQRTSNAGTSKKIAAPMYSTSTLTYSDGTFGKAPQHSGSAWSASSTSISGKSVSTISSKSRSQRSRSSRDLAWARKVIARNCRRGQQSSGPDSIAHSFALSRSRR